MWKQKGEEYRLFGGGGWVWTSGLQLRKRKHPGDEKDNFVNKKRKLLDTTNKIVALKEAKRKEVLKQEAEKAARMATQRAPLESTSVCQTVQSATTTTAASAPIQTSANTSSSTEQSAPLSQTVQTTATTTASAPAQTSAATSSTTQSAASQMVQTTATTTAVTGPAQTAVTVQTTAAPTSATLTPAASSQIVQATVTATAVTDPAQNSVTVQTTPVLTSATFTPAASSQSIQSAAVTTACDFPAQTSVFSQGSATSTCTFAAQSSVQNVLLTHNVASTSPSVIPCAVTTATFTGISTNTSSALPVVVSQNASPAPTSVISSMSASETTGNPVSAECVFSPITSTTSVLSGPEVQTSSGTALSTSLLTTSNSFEATSSGEKDTSASSSLVVNTDNSSNECSTPPSSSATIDIVSTTSSSALSSVSAAGISKCPSPLPAFSAAVEDDNSTSSSLVLANDYVATPPLSSATTDVVSTTSSSALSSVSTASTPKSSYPVVDSSANLLPSNSSGVSLSTEKIENHDHFPEVESKPDTLSGVGRDTLGSSDLYEANVSQSSAVPSPTTEISGDVGKTAVSPSLSCQEPEDQAFTCRASPSPLTGTNVKSRSEVFSSSFPEQNVSESTVAQDSSPSDQYLPQNPSPCILFSAEASQVSDLNSKCGAKNEVLLGSSLCSNQVSLVEDDVPGGVKEENASSALDCQPHTEELTNELSKDNSETITHKNELELSPDSDFVEQGPEQDKSSPLRKQSIFSTKEQISEQDERLANLSDVPMTSNDQGDQDHTKENAAGSKVTSSDAYVLESSAVQTKEETEKGFESSENNFLVYTQDTQDGVTDETRLNDTVLPDNREGHPSLLCKEASIVEPTEESETESKFEENRSVDISRNKVDISDDGVFPSDSLGNECLTSGNDTQEDKATDVAGVSAGTTKKDSDECDQTTVLNDSSLGSRGNVNKDFDLVDASIAANDNLNIDNNGECKEPKSNEQSECCTLDISRSEHVFNNDEAASLSDVKATVSTTTSEVERTESCTQTLVAAEPSEFDSSSPLKGDSIGSLANAIPDDSHENETNAEDITTYDSQKVFAVKESSDGGEGGKVVSHLSSEANFCQSVDSAEVTESSERLSSAKAASSALEMSLDSAEEPMDIDAITVSSNQSLAGVTSPPKCTNLHTEAEQPMDVDVTTVSSTERSKAATTPLTSDVLKHSQTAMSTEKTATSVASTSVPGPVLEETETMTSNENLSDTAMSKPCLTSALASAGGIATTDTANVPVMKSTTSVSSTVPSATTVALSAASPSRSAAQPSGLVKSAVTTVSQSSSSTASSAAATVSLKTTASIGSQPVVSVVPSSAALASPRVAVAGSQGGSPVTPLPQTILAKGVGSPPVVTAALTRGIAPQKIGLTIRPQGQTSQYVPIGPKPILPSPKTPALSTGLQRSNVVRIGTQPAASGQSNVAPVNSIAALVASIPTSGTTIGPSQLIRLVTPDGRTLTLQGSQLAALAQQAASPLGLSAPKTITLQVSATASQQNPGTPVQKTVGIKTPGAAITVQRPTQQVAQAKPQVVIKPKVETKPLKEEKFPSLEPVIKDPRALLNRRLAKWPLRHSVKSVFALPKHERRKLGRKAGLKEVRGYTYASRAVGVHWPAGIPRPSFKVAWRFRTQSLKTLAGAGLQLRILQSCLKWEEMNVRPPRGNSNTVYTSSGESSHIPLVHGNAWFDSLQLVVGSVSNNEPTDCNRAATGQEIVREQKVMGFYFESGEIEII